MDSLLDINNLSYGNNKITIILDDKGEPWFKLRDITIALEYENVYKHIDEEDKQVLEKISNEPLSHNERGTIYINEAGLYSLILSSKKEETKKFKKWIISDVLPSIRKHGEYKLKKEITNITLKLKQITLKKSIEPLKRNQYIYITSTNLYSKQNYFKVGGSITKIKINNKRLLGYNTDMSDEDSYFYFYVKECNDYKIIEDKLNIYLKNFKPNDKKEMYNILLGDLIDLIETLIENNNAEVEYMNTVLPKLYNNLIDDELVEDIEPVINDIENPIITFVTSNTLSSPYGKVNKKELYELYCEEGGINIDYKEFNKNIRDVLKLKELKSNNMYYWVGITMLNS